MLLPSSKVKHLKRLVKMELFSQDNGCHFLCVTVFVLLPLIHLVSVAGEDGAGSGGQGDHHGGAQHQVHELWLQLPDGAGRRGGPGPGHLTFTFDPHLHFKPSLAHSV